MGFKKKTLAVAAAAALTATTAVPALALENEFHGMFRLFGAVTNFNATDTTVNAAYDPTGLPKDPGTATYIAQRARLMYLAKANDNLKLVTQFEIDSRWGDNSYVVARNQGGAIGADSVNLETKSVYLDANCPVTGANFKVGIQPNGDSFKGVLFGADMAGIKASKTLGNLDVALGFFRFNDRIASPAAVPTPAEPNTIPGKQTRDMASIDTKYSLTKNVKVGGSYYFIGDDRPNDNYVHNVGVNGEAVFGPLTVDGFFLYQFGDAANERHVSAFAGNVGARTKLGPGTARTEFLYVSGDKGGSSTTNAFQSVDDEHGYYDGNMQLLFRDAYSMTIDNAIVYTSNNNDQGVIAGFIGYDLPVTSKLSTSFNAGFAAVAKENGNTPNTANGKYLGTEVNASVDYKLYDNLTASLRGAYVFLGDYYDGVAAGNEDPRNPYMGSVILNYAF